MIQPAQYYLESMFFLILLENKRNIVFIFELPGEVALTYCHVDLILSFYYYLSNRTEIILFLTLK